MCRTNRVALLRLNGIVVRYLFYVTHVVRVSVLALTDLHRFTTRLLIRNDRRNVTYIVLRVETVTRQSEDALNVASARSGRVSTLLLNGLNYLLNAVLVILAVNGRSSNSARVILLNGALNNGQSNVTSVNALDLSRPQYSVLRRRLYQCVVTNSERLRRNVTYGSGRSSLIITRIVCRVLCRRLTLIRAKEDRVLNGRKVKSVRASRHLSTVALIVEGLTSRLETDRRRSSRYRNDGRRRGLRHEAMFKCIKRRLLRRFQVTRSFRLDLSPSPTCRAGRCRRQCRPRRPRGHEVFGSWRVCVVLWSVLSGLLFRRKVLLGRIEQDGVSEDDAEDTPETGN